MDRSKAKALLDVLGINNINGLFASMDIAEEVMAATGNVPGAFIHLQPSEVLRSKAEWLFRSHCYEIVERVKQGKDTRPGTQAECLAALMEAATQAPLGQDARAAVATLWANLAPPDLVATADGFAPAYSPHGVADVIAETRRKMTCEWRK